MPILAMSAGTVTAVWGAAFIRQPNGQLKAVHVGDKVKGGEHILTEQDGIVQITPVNGPVMAVKSTAATEIDKAIAGIENQDPVQSPAAGYVAGSDGTLQPGLRVDRVAESLTPLEFHVETERVPAGTLLGASANANPLFATAAPTEGIPSVTPITASKLSLSSVTVNEGAGSAVFVISLDKPSTQPITVNYGTVDGTAKQGADYTAGSGSVTFQPGETSKTISVPITNDKVYEGSESFNVVLSNATNASIANGTGVGTIKDDGTGSLPDGRTPDNDTPVVNISTTLADVNEAAGTVTYTVTLSNPSAFATTVKYNTVDGQAHAGSDYTAATGTLTFAPGETSKTIVVQITNDGVYEGAESFQVQLSQASGATIGQGSVTTTIHDDGTGSLPPGTPDAPNPTPTTPDDDRPAVSHVGSPTVAEGGSLDFAVTLSGTSALPTTVHLTLTGVSATLGTDTGAAQVSFDGGHTFTTLTVDANGQATVTVPANTAADQLVVRVPTTPDNVTEGSETLSLSAQTDHGAAASGTGTIVDATSPATVSITGPADVNEAAGTITYTVTLNHASSGTVSVDFHTVDGSAHSGTDFTLLSGSPLVFQPGQTSQTITVKVNNDGVYEGAESFQVQLTGASGATVDQGSVTTTIHDDGTGSLPPGTPDAPNPTPGTPDDDRPAVSHVGSPTVAEGGSLDFAVTLSGTSALPTTVHLTLTGVSATLGTDTGAAQVSFDGGHTFTTLTVDANGQATVTVPANTAADQLVVRVPTTPDNVTEGSETLSLSAQTDHGAAASGTGTIVDATSPATVSITGPADVNEAAGTITYTVTLNHASSGTVSVDFHTVDGSAHSGTDFTLLSGSPLVFQPGQTSQTITVKVNNDGVYEGAESFQVQLTGASGATVDQGSVTTTIHDDGTGSLPPGTPDAPNPPTTPDDDRPVLSVSDVSVKEGDKAVFTVDLGHASSNHVALHLSLADGTAHAGADFSNTLEVSYDQGATWQAVVNGLADVPAGTLSLLVRVPTHSDALLEGNETFTLHASSDVAANAQASGTATIADQTQPTPTPTPCDPDDQGHEQGGHDQGHGGSGASGSGDHDSGGSSAGGSTEPGSQGGSCHDGAETDDHGSGEHGSGSGEHGSGAGSSSSACHTEPSCELDLGSLAHGVVEHALAPVLVLAAAAVAKDQDHGSSGECAPVASQPESHGVSLPNPGDVFAWHLGDGAASHLSPDCAPTSVCDTIAGFNMAPSSAGGDVLDLRDVLQAGATPLQHFLDFDTSSISTVIKVSASGSFSQQGASNGCETERIVLENVNLRADLGLADHASNAQVITSLLEHGKLLVDHA